MPGNYNHTLLAELFHIQSSRWPAIAEGHLDRVLHAITTFTDAALHHIIHDDHVRNELSEHISLSLEKSASSARQDLSTLCQDEQRQPITYNHYYTDNVQQSRQDSTRKLLQKAMDETKAHDWNGKLHVSNNTVDAEKLLASLQKRIVVNMDSQACTEALAGLKAYYKVVPSIQQRIYH